MFRSRDIQIFVFLKSTYFKICDVHLRLFLLSLKFYQNEIWSNTRMLY